MTGRHARPREPRGHWLLLLCVLPLVFATLLAEGWTTHQVQHPGPRLACTSPAPVSVDRGGPVRAYENGRPVSDKVPAGTVGFTVDGGPDPTWTPRFLDLLRRHRAHATFFVHGAQAARHPGLMQRIRDDGHEVGSLTYTGAALGSSSGPRARLELELTQKALAGATGYRTGLLRMPQSTSTDTLCGAEGDAADRAAADGYLVVAADKWFKDASDGVVRQFPQTEAGYARAEQLLRNPKVERFTTVTRAVGREPTDRRASPTEIWEGMALIAVRNVGHLFTSAMTWVLALTIGLALLRLLLLALWARAHVRRLDRYRPGSPWLREVTERVTVLVPAHNEEAGIQSTLRSLLASTHPYLQVVVVDDGSTDRTAELAAAIGDPRVLVVRQPNAGKAAALNTGLSYAECDIVVMVDGDTVFEPDAIRRLIQPLAHPAVGAVSGNTKVGNRRRLLGRWQHLEYVCGFNLDRRMFEVLECMPTVPGAIGAFRRDALLGVGGVSDDTLAEDTDLTMALWRGGWRVVYEETAVAWTEVPTTLRQLWRQRYRWCYGTMQAMWKHRHAAREVGPAGRFGRRGLTYIALFQIVLPLFTPVMDVFAIYGLFFADPLKSAGVWLGFLAGQLAIAAYALRLDGERMRTLWSLPLQLFTYRQLMYLVVIQSLVTVLAGTRLPWQRIKRAGTAAEELGGVAATAGTTDGVTTGVVVAHHETAGAVGPGAQGHAGAAGGPVRAAHGSVPATHGAMPAAHGPVPAAGGAIPAPGGPVPAAHGPAPAGAGVGAVAAGAGAATAASAPGQVLPGGPPPEGTVVVSRTSPALPLDHRIHGSGTGNGHLPDPFALRPRPRPDWGRRFRRTAAVLGCAALLSPPVVYVWADSRLDRGPDLGSIAGRPSSGPGTTYLIVGSDSRAGLSEQARRDLHTGSGVGRRTDSMILLHTGAHGTTMMSLPRDSWVELPSLIRPGNGKQYGAEHNKLNAAFSLGGPEFLVETVERNTGLRIDHYAEVGFGGFVGIVDAVGGVRMCLDRPVKDEKSGADLPAGCQVLNGAEALAFVRQRHQEADGDLGRTRNQQKFLSALARQAAASDVYLDLPRMHKTAAAGLDSVIVDRDTGLTDLVSLAKALRGVTAGDGRRVEVPVADPAYQTKKGSAVRWNRERAQELFDRLRNDRPVGGAARDRGPQGGGERDGGQRDGGSREDGEPERGPQEGPDRRTPP